MCMPIAYRFQCFKYTTNDDDQILAVVRGAHSARAVSRGGAGRRRRCARGPRKASGIGWVQQQ